jgi:putative ABC transport system permease protein
MWLLTALDIRYRAVRFAVVTIGTALVFTLLFLMTGLIEQFNQEPFLMVDQVSTDDWVVPEGSSGPFTSSQVLRPDQVQSIGAQGSLVVARGTTEIDGVASEGIVLGLGPDTFEGLPLAEGRTPDADLEAAVDETTGLGIDDTFEMGGASFTVVGLTSDTTLLAGQPAIFIRIFDARTVMFEGSPVTMAVLVEPGTAADVAGTVALSADEVAEDALGPLESAVSSIDLIRILLWIVAAIIIGAVVYLSALERQRDFAVLLAVGGRSRQLAGSLAIQAVFVALLAVGTAAVLQAVVAPVFPLKVRVPAASLWQLPAVAVVVALLAASAAMRKVRKTDPAAAFGGPA